METMHGTSGPHKLEQQCSSPCIKLQGPMPRRGGNILCFFHQAASADRGIAGSCFEENSSVGRMAEKGTQPATFHVRTEVVMPQVPLLLGSRKSAESRGLSLAQK